jgi:excinuclease UvrABC nuclease subunit
MAGVRGDESDVFGFYREGSQAVLQVFSIRSGKVVDRDSFLLENIDFHDDAALVEASLKQYYELGRFLPSTIQVPTDFPYREAVAEQLSAQKESRVEILVPRRGGKKRLVELVSKNAFAYDPTSARRARAFQRLRSSKECSSFLIGPSASRASTSRTSREARSSPRWWSSSAASPRGATTASSRSGASRKESPTTSPLCARW